MVKILNKSPFILCCIFFLSASIFAQTENVSEQLDLLRQKKDEITAQKKSLKAEIEKLEQTLTEKDAELKTCNETLFRVKYGNDVASRVAAGRVWKGMNEEMLKASWGKPDKVETNREKWGVFSQWYYGDIVYFFREGKLQELEEGYDYKNLKKEKREKQK